MGSVAGGDWAWVGGVVAPSLGLLRNQGEKQHYCLRLPALAPKPVRAQERGADEKAPRGSKIAY